MPYAKQTWLNGSVSQTTPLSAARLQHIEDGIEGATRNVVYALDHGVVADGTTDSTLAAQDAILTAIDEDAVLIWPAGTVLITDTLLSGQVLSYTWSGIRNERGCNAEGARPGYALCKILFRPSDTTKPLVRIWSTTSPDSLLGPYLHRGLTFDFGDANGFFFGVEDPLNPTVVAPNPLPSINTTPQRYIFSVRFEGCALAASFPVLTGATLSRSGRRMLSLVKCFETVVEDTSMIAGDTQVFTYACDRPTFRNIRSQYAHLPFDFNESEQFAAQHAIDNLQVEGWGFTPIRTNGVEFAGSNLRLEQNVGGGRYSIPGTVSVTAGSGTLTFSQSMTNILFPNLSILELTSGTNTLLALVTGVSGTSVTIDTSATVVTWTAAAATAVRIHGYGPIHKSSYGATYTNVAPGAQTDCPSFVYVLSRGTMAVLGAVATPGATGDIRSAIIGNRLVGQSSLQSILTFSGCNAAVIPLGHPFVTVDNYSMGYGASADDVANVRTLVGNFDEQEAIVARKWVFAPGRSGAAISNAHLVPIVRVTGDANTTQKVWAWHRYSNTSDMILQDETLPSDSRSRVRIRFRARSVGATGELRQYFFGNGASGTVTFSLTDTWTTYEYTTAMPAAWQGVKTVVTAVVFDAAVATERYYLAGCTVEELVPPTSGTGWATPTGTTTKTAFDTGTVTLPQLAERVKGVIEHLIAKGELGA